MNDTQIDRMAASKRLDIHLIKPSHYDDQGYVLQWVRSYIPSNSLGCLYSILCDVIALKTLGDDVALEVQLYDETHTVIPIQAIIDRTRSRGTLGLVMLAGVQSNQFPRAVDLARPFLAAGLMVAIGGFHVSGCIAMLKNLPPDLQEASDMGIALFAGEAENHLEPLLREALQGKLQKIYNYLDQLVDLAGQVGPIQPHSILEKYVSKQGTFDAGRGCPFKCSFCTVINVQGTKSRFRTGDDVERLVKAQMAQGSTRFFITDDNFARNRNWEEILDRFILLRQRDGIKCHIVLQVDTQSYRIPGFVDKAAQAGVNRIFVGLESISLDNLGAVQKGQNRVATYREMFQAWHKKGVANMCGYILGFPSDTPESIAREIKIIQDELPVDLIEFFYLTPLPGSVDHKTLYEQGTWMDPDMNKYDLEHPTAQHPTMSNQSWTETYHRAWELYYTPEHIETLMRRAEVTGITANRMAGQVTQFYGCIRYEKVNPMQGGIVRRKVRTSRRYGLPLENPLIFYPRRLVEILTTYIPMLFFLLRVQRIRKRVENTPDKKSYLDKTLI